MFPHNMELEKIVIGCLSAGKSKHVTTLKEDDFYSTENQMIYKAINYMFTKNKTIDAITVSDILKNKLDDSLIYLMECVGLVTTTENIEHYIEQLQKYRIRRQAIKAAEQIKLIATQNEVDDVSDFKSELITLLDFDVGKENKKSESLYNLTTKVIDQLEAEAKEKNDGKLLYGLQELDIITAGLHKAELNIVAARPGIGKTAFALQVMLNLARRGTKCLFVSGEMANMQIVRRIMSNLTMVDGNKIRQPKNLQDNDWQKIAADLDLMANLPIEVTDNLLNVQDIRAYCKELKSKNKLDCLVVDYVGLMQTSKKCESRRLEIEDISRQFKKMTIELDIPIILLSQLSREAVKGRPELHHLRESGSIEQDADNVLFLHIPTDTDEKQDSFDIEVIVAKQRNGPTGFVKLQYFRKIFKFYSKQ
jgi:replicative DNA helicase